jgi:hypothetical protein
MPAAALVMCINNKTTAVLLCTSLPHKIHNDPGTPRLDLGVHQRKLRQRQRQAGSWRHKLFYAVAVICHLTARCAICTAASASALRHLHLHCGICHSPPHPLLQQPCLPSSRMGTIPCAVNSHQRMGCFNAPLCY